MKKKIFCLISCALILFACDNKCRKGCTGMIRGKVTDVKTGLPVANAKISINSDEDFTYTNIEGIYELEHDLQANYIYDFKDIEASKIPFYLSSEKEDMIIVDGENNSNEEYDYDFELTPVGDITWRPSLLCVQENQNSINIELENSGIEDVEFTITSITNWIDISPTLGTVTGNLPFPIEVNVNNANLTCVNYGYFIINNLTRVERDTLEIKKINEDLELPFADFTFFPSTITRNDEVRFTSLSTDNCSSVDELQYRWEFDTGLGFTNWSNLNEISFIYDQIGEKTVTFEAKDLYGNVSEPAIRNLIVQESPTPPICEPDIQINTEPEPLTLRLDGIVLDYGEIFQDIGLLDYGFVWGVIPNVTIDNNEGQIQLGLLNGASSPAPQPFEALMTGFQPLTRYFIRSYAQNSAGICYSDPFEYTADFLNFKPLIFSDPNGSGSFVMGSGNGNESHQPEHNKIVSAFWMAETETTNEEYAVFLNTDVQGNQAFEYLDIGQSDLTLINGFFYVTPGRENYPIRGLTWFGAQAFCEWAGGAKNGRLPTEAQWEFAAKAQTDPYIYSGSDSPQAVAWYLDNSNGETHQVGQLLPNGFGFYDMSGNVAEWVSDWYDEDFYTNTPLQDNGGPLSGTNRVIRGGNIALPESSMPLYLRFASPPSVGNIYNGCRCIRDPD